MGKVHHLLLLEDDESDADLIRIELDKLDIDIRVEVIAEKDELISRLKNDQPDLIISDYNLPSFTGTEALSMVREKYPHLPFILVSGYIGEEKAVDAMRKGASDYAMKENLDRLGASVRREIANYEEHKQQQEKLKETQARYETLVKSVNGIVWEADVQTFEFYYISPQSQKILGYSPKTWLQTPNFWQEHIHPEDREKAITYCQQEAQKGSDHTFEYRMIDANGEVVWLRDYVTVVSEGGKPVRMRGLMVNISKQKKAEQQRDKAYHIADIGHWELDLINEELNWSDTVKKLHEVGADYKPELDTAINFYKEGEHRRKISDAVENAIETGEPFDTELKIITSGGNEKWVRAVGETEFRNGKCVRIYGSTQDITQRKETEQKLRDVVEHSTNMFYRHDTEHVLSYVSPQAADFLGCSPEEAKIRWTEFVTDHPINEKGFQNTQRAIETGERQPSFTLQLRKVNGETIWVRVSEAPMVENGETVAIVGSLTDITEQREYEEQLQESLERYEYVTEATSDAVWDWDLQEDTVFWGRGFENLFGYKVDELAKNSSSWTDHIHPDDKDWVYSNIQEAIQGDDQNWFEEYRYLRADGRYAYVEDRGFIIRDENGEALRMIGAMRDVTEEKQIEIQTTLKQKISRFFKLDEELDNILQNVLQYLTIFGHFSTAEIWLTSFDTKHLNLISSYAKDKPGKNFYKNSKDISKFVKGEGLPGTVWSVQQIQVWNNIDTANSFIRKKAAKKGELKSALGLPLFHNENFVGTLLLGSSEMMDESSFELSFYEELEQFLGAEIIRKQQEQEFRLLFESAPDLMAIAGPNDRFVKVNPTFCELLGYTEEEITSQSFENFLHPDDLEPTKTEYQETITGKRQADNFINRYRTKSGEYRWLSWSSSPAFGEDDLVFSYARDITQKMELEQLLEQAQKMARIGAWELDLKSETIFWSPITREIHEAEPDFTPDLEEGLNFYKESESRETIRKAVERAIEEGESWDEELKIITAKGNEKWVRTKGEPLFADGGCVKIYGSFQDIHDRKTFEVELEQRNEFIEAILNNLPIGIAVNRIDDEKTILMNDKFSEIYGWPEEDLTNVETFFEKVFPDEEYRKEIAAKIREDLESGNPDRMEWDNIKITTKEGEQRIIDGKNIPLFDQNQMISTVIDVTAEKKAEREKAETLQRIGDAFFAVDEDWTVTYWNKRAEEMIGTPREQVVGKNLWEVYDDAVELEFYSKYHKAVKEQKAVQFEEYYPTLEKWFEVSAYPSETGLSVYFRDVTERKKSEERIRQINKRFEKVTKATNDAIWDFNVTDDDLFWGKGFETLFGYDPDETDPDFDFLISLIHPEDRDRDYWQN
ncbi:MAG: PAS domain S-box protein [Balneolaceae bacterium]|nr:PAS domain S-box protein [Balneolaceae bacterium]